MNCRRAAIAARALASLLALGATALPAAAAYLIRPGDVLAVDIAGVAGMRQRLPVDTDGTVRVPLIGTVEVAGKSLEDVNDAIQTRFASKSLRQMTTAGQEYQLVFDQSQVLVTIEEYRPVYVNGDVFRPGQQAFRPGMTVRQAIALSGGYDATRLRGLTPEQAMQVPDQKAELTTLWADVARDTMRIQSLTASLEGSTTPPAYVVKDVPLPPADLAELERLERDRYIVDASDHEKEAKFLRDGLESSKLQMGTVTEQQSNEKAGLAADNEELARLAEMEKKGNTTSNRVTDARRNVLISSTRYLQATAQIAAIERDQDDMARRLDKLYDARKSILLKEKLDTVAHMKAARNRILAVYEKLGQSQSMTQSQSEADKPTLKITRSTPEGAREIEATDDTELQPADVVEASVPLDNFMRRRSAQVE